MDQTEQVFICQYQGHENEPISGFCLNQTCKEKHQFCVQCLMNKHQDHKGDCKTIVSFKLMLQMDAKEIPNMISQANAAFQNVKKVYQSFTKLLTGEINKLLAFEKNFHQPLFYLYNKDFLRLKRLNAIVRKLVLNNYQNFFQSMINEMVKMKQAFVKYGQFQIQEVQKLKSTKQFSDFEYNLKAILQGNIFQNEIIAECEKDDCCDQQQCCQYCIIKSNSTQIIFEALTPIIRFLGKILSMWLSTVDNFYFQAKQLNLMVIQFLENQDILIKEMEIILIKQDYYQFMICLNQTKKWIDLKKMYLEKMDQNNLTSNFLLNFLGISETIMKYLENNVDQTIYNKQITKRKIIILNEVNINVDLKPLGLLKQGLALYKMNRYEDAIQCYDQAIKQDPSDYVVFNNKGLALQNLNRYEDAIQCFDQAIKLNPSYSFSFYNKGFALYNLNRYEDAIQCFDQAIKLDPCNSIVFYFKGLALSDLNLYDDAIQCYDQAIKLNPSNPLVFYSKGLALYNLNRYEDAIQCFDQAIKLNPSYFFSFYKKGLALQNLNRYQEAISCFNQVIKLDPSDPRGFYSKGLALSDLNLYDDAIQCYDQAIKLDPSNYIAFQQKRKALQNLNRYQDAIQFYDQAIKLDPSNSEVFYLKGKALSDLNLYDDAIQCFDQAIKLDPSYSEVFYFKGLALSDLNLYDDAIQCYDQAIKLNPSNPLVFYSKGLALYNLNRYEDAIQCFDQAINLNPSYSFSFYKKGLALQNLNRYQEAISCFNQAITIDPSNDNAKIQKEIAFEESKLKEKQQN